MTAKQFCSIPECGKALAAKGMCTMHYARVRNHGRADAAGTTPNGTVQRYCDEVVLRHTDESVCLLWPYTIGRNGYGQMWSDGRMRTATRLVCEAAHGSPPTEKHAAAHSCGVRLCVNPTHLRWATRTENEADKIAHGTHMRGEKRGAVLNETQVLQIRGLKGKETQASIAKRYGVTFQVISDIMRRRTWAWLEV